MNTDNFKHIKLPPAVADGATFEHPRVLPLPNAWESSMYNQDRISIIASTGRHTK